MTEEIRSMDVDKLQKHEVRQVAEAHDKLRQALPELKAVGR